MGFISKYRFYISLIDDSIFLCLLVNHIHLTAIIFGEFLKFGNILNIKNLLKVTLMLSMFITSATKSFAADNFEKLFIGIMGAAIGSAAQKSAQQKQVGNTSQLTQQSNLVRRSQIALKTLGFYTSSVDGKLGTNTNSAAQLYVNKYKIQNFSFGEIKDVLRLEQIAEQSVTIVTHSPPKAVPIEKAGFFGPNKATLSIGSYKNLGEVGLTITEFYQKNKLALNDVQFSVFSTNSGYYVVTLGVGSTQKCERVRSLGVRRKVIPSDSYCSLGDGFKDSYIFKGGEIRASNNWYALNLISVGLPPVNYDSESDDVQTAGNTLVFATLKKDTQKILMELKEFVSEGGRFVNPSKISKTVYNLEQNIQKKELENIARYFKELQLLLNNENSFSEYQEKLLLIAKESKARAVSSALSKLEKYNAFISDFVSKKPFDKKSTVLIGMGEDIAKALKDNDMDGIIDIFDGISKKLSALNLYKEAEKFKIIIAEDVGTTVAGALEKEALLAEANVIISSIKSYNDEGGEFKDKRAIGRGFANLNKAISKQEDLVSAIEAIKEVYSTDEDFKNFKDRKIKAANVAEAEALQEATDRVLKLKNFILQTVDENPLSDRVGLLYETDDKAADILSRGDRSSILNFYSEAMVTLKSLGLDQDYTSYLKRVSLEAKSGDVAAIVADDQQKRLKRENLNQRGSTLMADVKKYIKEGQTFKFAVELARGVAALNSAQGRDSNEDELLEAIKILEHSVKNDIKFQEFRELEIQLRAAKDNDSVTLASDEVELVKNFIVSEISSDPLRKDLADLIEVLDIVKNAILEGKSSILLLAIDESMQKFGDLKLRKKFNRYKNETEIEKSLKGVKTVKNGLAITALNSDILSGDKRDIIALENRSGSAPNILRDLSGSVVFSNNTASVCWAGKPVNKNFSTRFVLKTLKELGVRNVKSFERCVKTEFDQVDIVLIHRGTFLIQKADYASKLIEKFESEQLSVFDTWFGEDTEEKIKIERSRGQKYLREVKAELLKGYGFILLENESPNLCMIIEEAEDQKLHNSYLDAEIEEIGLWVPDIKNRVSTNIEKSFAMAQKEMCKIIYAEAKDLKVITGGLEREKIPFALSGLWATEDALSNLSSEIAEEKDGFERDLAKIRQDFEAQRVLKETIEAELAKKTNKIQKELRKKYSQEANGASNKVKVYLEAVFNPEKFAERNSQEQLVKTQTDFNRAFSVISRWWRIKEMSLWEAKNHSFEIFDYGTAEWKGRRLETITGKLNIEIQNPVLGQKDNKCVLLSIMIDDEFGYFRDSDEAKCSNSSSISVWQNARNFESRWVAN